MKITKSTLSFLFLSLFTFGHGVLAQVRIPYRNFEMIDNVKTEIIAKDQKYFRKNDNILLTNFQMNKEVLGNTNREKAINYLKSNWGVFGHKESFENTLFIDENATSDDLIIFKQEYFKLPVDFNTFSLLFDKLGKLVCFNQNTKPILRKIDLNEAINLQELELKLKQYFACKFFKRAPRHTLMIHDYKGKNRLVYKSIVETYKPKVTWEVYSLAKTGQIIEVIDNSVFFDGQGRIFDIDPVSSSHGVNGQNGLLDAVPNPETYFEKYMIDVVLPNIIYFNGAYRLESIYSVKNARITDLEISPIETFENTTAPIFKFARNHNGFQAVMCYYYIDKTLTYVKTFQDLNFHAMQPSQLFFDPHDPDDIQSEPSSYDQANRLLRIANGISKTDATTVDHGEDAMMILHETGHFIHNVLGGINIPYVSTLSSDGIGEGFGDYWAASEANERKQYRDYEPGYNRIFRWAFWNEETVQDSDHKRTVNSSIPYPFPSGSGKYDWAQVLSTVLTKIYNDIGKSKTDYIVLKGIKLAGGNAATQPELADFIYTASVGYSDWERCIIWNHFNTTYNTKHNSDPNVAKVFISTEPSSIADLYMRDDVDDSGIEENPANVDMWLSEDIWTKQFNISYPVGEQWKEYIHENPEYRKNSLDYVKVRIRSKGCAQLSTGNLEVYWAKASTGLKWPDNWNGSADPKLSGLVGLYPLSLINLKAGEETIVTLNWIPPNPDDFNDNDKHHYCLLARINSSNDPMHCIPEVANPNINAKCNNNIVWKNITILTTPGFTIDTGIVIIRDINSSLNGPQPSCLEIKHSDLPHYDKVLDNATLNFKLRDSLLAKWIAGGMQGYGFSYNTESGIFTVNSLPVKICNLNLIPMHDYYMDFYVAGNGNPKPYLFDLRHYYVSGQNPTIGGERFVYSGNDSNNPLPRSNKINKMIKKT